MLSSAIPSAAEETIPFRYSNLLTDGKTANIALALEQGQTAGPVPALNQVPRSKRAKGGKTFLMSALIPGWSQYQQGRRSAAAVFIGAEIVFWGGLFGVKAYGNWLEDDYKAFALEYANINPWGKDHDYYVNLGNYNSVDDFNQVRQRRREYDALYQGDEYYWSWESEAHRLEFRDLRISADSYQRNAIFFAGAIVLNHLVSAVEAVKNKPKKNEVQFGVEINARGNTLLTIRKEF